MRLEERGDDLRALVLVELLGDRSAPLGEERPDREKQRARTAKCARRPEGEEPMIFDRHHCAVHDAGAKERVLPAAAVGLVTETREATAQRIVRARFRPRLDDA